MDKTGHSYLGKTLLLGWGYTRARLVGYIAVAGLDAAAVIVICWKTGEKPRWRWGR